MLDAIRTYCWFQSGVLKNEWSSGQFSQKNMVTQMTGLKETEIQVGLAYQWTFSMGW